jgi:hypothetical protein
MNSVLTFPPHIATSKPNNPVMGELWMDFTSSTMYVYANGKWLDIYKTTQDCIEKISQNQFTCINTFSSVIDMKIKEIGLESIKKGRKFDKVLYTIEDETELNIFSVYFSESIK